MDSRQPNDENLDRLSQTLGEFSATESRHQQELFQRLYGELRSMAAQRLRMLPPGNTLQATALVNEVWIRLEQNPEEFERRQYFFSAAARAMRDILVEQVRRKESLKRGGDHMRADAIDMAELVVETRFSPTEFLALHDALDELEETSPRKAQIVMLRFFSGLEHREIASLLSLSERTVQREWNFAKAWLKLSMQDD